MKTLERHLILGLDAGCMTCSELAHSIEEAAGGRLEVRSLHDPQVEHWRKQALGENAPWAPTLIEVEGAKVKAWTGLRMGLVLSRKLGPVTTWRVMQALGEVRQTPESGKVGVLDRAQFLKGLGGAAVAMSILSSPAASSAYAKAQERSSISKGTSTQRKAVEKTVRSSEQYKNAMLRAGKTFDFGRAKFAINDAVGVAALVVPTDVATGGRNAVATFFINIQSKTVFFFDCLVQTKVGNRTEVIKYQNDKPLAQLVFESGYVTLPGGRKISIEQFKKEVYQPERHVDTFHTTHQSILNPNYSTLYCTNGCCRGSFDFCEFIATLGCALAEALSPLAALACEFIKSYADNRRAGCNAFAETRCYNLHRCGCPKM